MAYNKSILASYEDFEEYFLEMTNDYIDDKGNTVFIGVKKVVIGTMEDVETVQKNATTEIYPMLFVHIPSFESFNSGGNKNHFETDFLALERHNADTVERRRIFNLTRNIVLNIQKKMEADAQNGVFDFDGRLQAQPKTNLTFGKCLGWFVSFEIATPGVGVDSDYRQ